MNKCAFMWKLEIDLIT